MTPDEPKPESLGDRWDTDGEQLDEMVDEAQAPEEPAGDEE